MSRDLFEGILVRERQLARVVVSVLLVLFFLTAGLLLTAW